ncbi:NAD-dependent epimerase/dehydratase family protein [Paenibacillus flagellatus]|uniref:Oxidoreductase n=1 Tax=Paenibacillus flagellatus TaxID=2211139 RepID=A0A2V5JXM1_9BACL|nr:NAD-dependent epimerase/dehydratase family protein [Paenibacillus flagellatus]PYI51599.1 oxidoreductase [Paenibacillus flagellatus]
MTNRAGEAGPGTGNRTAIVAGATGLIGRELVRQLLEDDGCDRVIALVRRPTGSAHPKLEERPTDYERLGSGPGDDEGFGGADLFCALGTTIKKAGSQAQFRKVDLDYPLRLGEIGARAGARSYSLVSAMGANAKSGVFYNRVKGETEERLAALGPSAFYAFRPSLLLGERDEFRFGERAAAALAKPLSFVFTGPLANYKPIEAAAVAAAMIATARTGSPGRRVVENGEIAAIAASAKTHNR